MMSKSIFGAVTMVLFLAACASAQASDSSQSMMQQRMQQMQQRMESMQQMMQQHMQDMQGGMQGMQMHQSEGGGQSMRGMQGMGMQEQVGARDQCLASSQQAGLSALLMGSGARLSLTDQQRAELEEILARARSDALDALTPEQRDQLQSAPAATPATCPRTTGTAPAAN